MFSLRKQAKPEYVKDQLAPFLTDEKLAEDDAKDKI